MVEFAANIWAEGPASDPYEPKKYQIRDWGTWVEGVINSSLSGAGFAYSTLSSLSADLGKAAQTMAWVIGDATVANNGVYRKVGAAGSGSWTRVSDLPYAFIVGSDVGAGTENAIVATSSMPVGANSLVWLKLAKTTTDPTVTVSFNGTTPVPIRTNSGSLPMAGSLKAGMTVMGLRTNSTFQLISDVASSAILAACEAVAKTVYQRSLGPFASGAAADAYATANLITKLRSTTYYNTTTSLWYYWDGSDWQPFPYTTVADGAVTAAKLPAATERVSLAAIRRRLRSIPDLGDYGITASGVTSYGQSDFSAVASGLKADGHRQVLVPEGNYRLAEQITLADGIMFEGESKSASVLKFHHTGTGFVFTGGNETGGGMKRLSIVNDVGALAVAYLQLIADVGGASPDYFVVSEVNMTCFGS